MMMMMMGIMMMMKVIRIIKVESIFRIETTIKACMVCLETLTLHWGLAIPKVEMSNYLTVNFLSFEVIFSNIP